MAEINEIKKRSALAGWPMIIGWAAMLIFALHSSTHMVGAGDTWVAMACGRHFLNHGVDTVEPFSANSHKAGPTEQDIENWPAPAKWIADKVGLDTVKYWHPTGWVNQNWMTHVIFYWLTHQSPFADADTFSFNSLVYWKFAIYIITVICVYYIGRLLGVNPALSAVFACFAMFVGRSFFDIRPAGFSNIFVAIFLLTLVLATYRNILYIWLIVPIAAFWCNLHGGYIYMFITLVPFVGLNFLTSISKKRFTSIGLKGVYHATGASIAAFVATIIFNPFHLTNLTHTFVISVSEHAKQWRTVNEWHPAFEWSNPVGTSYPFFVMFILSIGLTISYFATRLLKPKLLKIPKKQQLTQRKNFTTLSNVLGISASIFLFWVTFIAFGFIANDGISFLICAFFSAILLLSVCINVHFIYLTVLVTVLALWGSQAEPAYAGRYIYPFIIMPSYFILHVVYSALTEKIKYKPRNILIVSAAAAASFVLMIVFFNPLKVASPWWSIKSLLQLSHPWYPRYTHNAQPDYTYLPIVLYVLNIGLIGLWFSLPKLRAKLVAIVSTNEQTAKAEPYRLPKIDIALMAIAALTIYMAIRSRRFIPIAAIVACPVIAMLIDQAVRAIAAARNFHKKGMLVVPAMPHRLQVFFIITGLTAVLFFGSWWGTKFKTVYLDPWPTDTKFNSVFMRMTASNAKPFYACQFIRENKLDGKMFNYWTEGGFIAWGQEPDPNTGKTPLQLFMDGRAQAAYEREDYDRWMKIMSGGPDVFSAKTRGTAINYDKAGKWISEKLKRRQVWLILMPTGQFNTPFVKGIEKNQDWRIVFLNEKQRLFVDVTTDKGKKVFGGIFTGKTRYPDDFSENLIKAYHLKLARNEDIAKQSLALAIKAFESNPCHIATKQILFAARFPSLSEKVYRFCKNYIDEFEKSKEQRTKEDGYHDRIVSVMNIAEYLRRVAAKQNNPDLAERYESMISELNQERIQVVANKRW